jgi:hypothetical protein
MLTDPKEEEEEEEIEDNACEICGGHSGTRRGLSVQYFSFLPSPSFHQCASHSFVYFSLTQYSLSN